MTSDAKIGLLLGLVFIFIIAFLINGLPDFSRGTNNNELTTNMVMSQKDSPGIAAKERKVNMDIVKQEVRFQTELPKRVVTSEEIMGQTRKAAMPVIPKKSIETLRRTVQKVYVVEEGDSLSVIAKKVYGQVEGNRKVNVARIFEANQNLKSRDKIYVGQKLFIPMLQGRSFKKVETLAGKNTVEGRSQKSSGKWYVVRDGDSLWDIASEHLGNGSRYYEIARLNTNILSDEDNLVVGMRLKLPAR